MSSQTNKRASLAEAREALVAHPLLVEIEG